MASVSIDPKIRLKLCSELQEIATELYKEPTELLEVDKVKELKEFYSAKKPALTDSVQFHQLISKCELILPEPKVAPRNPELEARIKKLKVKQEQREYEKMTGNVDPWRNVELIDRQDKPISKQCKFFQVPNYFIRIGSNVAKQSVEIVQMRIGTFFVRCLCSFVSFLSSIVIKISKFDKEVQNVFQMFL